VGTAAALPSADAAVGSAARGATAPTRKERGGGMGAGTGGAGWAIAHPGKNQGGHGPPWKF